MRVIYLTNAVKHFRFVPKGKKRIHQSPRVSHVDQCGWWLEAERRLVQPRLTLAMGATAVRALHGKALTVEAARRGFTCLDGGDAFASLHPAAILPIHQSSAHTNDRAAFAALILRHTDPMSHSALRQSSSMLRARKPAMSLASPSPADIAFATSL